MDRETNRVRVSRACDRCKKRKIRCTGTQPCNICIRAAAYCLYTTPHNRGRRPPPVAPSNLQQPGSTDRNENANDLDESSLHYQSNIQPLSQAARERSPDVIMTAAEPPSRASPAPALADLQGHYVGPASGVSFLQRIQKQLHHSDRTWSTFTFGDAPLPEFDPTCCVMMSREETTRLFERYFDFTVPVDRFLHRQTLEAWLAEFHDTMGAMRNNDHAPARRAVLWMVFALAQEHMNQNQTTGNDNNDRSTRFFLAADYQLSRERGAVSLASVQARLCQCLWLLSQSRMNHCWQLFGSAARLALALGLHRCGRAEPAIACNRIELESSRRTFWNAYCLDNYLSIVFGRPRLFHDEDVDQELPSSADDADIFADHIAPQSDHAYSIMLAPVAYFKLSRIVSMILRDLYPIRPLRTADRCAFAAKYSQNLKTWRAEVPRFLNAENKDRAPLIPIFQRQRNILNLAYWHTVILTHRPFLLSNRIHITNTSRASQLGPHRAQIEESVDQCLRAALCVVEIMNELSNSGQMFRSFWLSSYFTFSAAAILYVYTVQQRTAPPAECQNYYFAATQCQRHLANLAEPGSLVERYCLVLEELRKEALSVIERPLRPAGSDMIESGVPPINIDQGPSVLDGQVSFPNPGVGDPVDFQSSPENSLADMAAWLQFESMAVSGFSQHPQWFNGIVYTEGPQ
ncbi:hypothetical protein BU24DRAFT_497644 [Aaosphaeria arxii CBS 175.79]|uniref:Zn(2)-C6 fungal-type domain-containing protein n=1 Tax=Aaosphaeria arxii CBS 175.79 TaxID=1450172 RepID=A0A6A5X827_9PLEO|nr:uncharacterized protein BU24DRAFT_497644 [Aaosphaeria arxii CBS 175.79]KAF2009103.1 hypothetical protein BU24DRAFT_497644 [Aaosphaeria arxii CBS 175.79]